MKLEEYQKKRHFEKTSEPKETKKRKQGNSFVVQKHQASHLHYDFRLEIDGVLKSWAIPKGPSLNPSEKRLAIQVEDHPVEYKDFERVIPSGEYGAGTVMIWDFGTYESPGGKNLSNGLKKGRIKFQLQGQKLKGGFILIQTKYQDNMRNWLFIKEKDAYARRDLNITKEQPNSAFSKRSLEEIAQSKIDSAGRGI